MKKILLITLMCIVSLIAYSQEISLFDSDGEPRAYIDADDEDCTIYLWDGTPVCYLSQGSNESFNIYGFNGTHIGWFDDGLVIDHDGNVIGFQKGATSKYTKYESYKGYKKYKPFKEYKEYAPYKPYTSNSFSTKSFVLFLKKGIMK